MGQVPKWAADLAEVAVAWWNQTQAPEQPVERPPITWWRSKTHKKASGRTYAGRIHVTAGRDRMDQRIVLLHELAHWVTPLEHFHDAAFWDNAWQLFRWAKLPIRRVLLRETSYRSGAYDAYRRSVPARSAAHSRAERPVPNVVVEGRRGAAELKDGDLALELRRHGITRVQDLGRTSGEGG